MGLGSGIWDPRSRSQGQKGTTGTYETVNDNNAKNIKNDKGTDTVNIRVAALECKQLAHY